MKQIIQIPALVEATSSDEMVEASISLSVDHGQITLEIPEWESRIEIPVEHLTQALATLAPAEKEPALSPVLVQHLGQKVSRLEQQIAATPQQRLELEAMGENLEALRREVLPRLVVVESWRERIEALEKTSYEELHTSVALGKRIEALENNLAEPPAEPAALALYGGEQ